MNKKILLSVDGSSYSNQSLIYVAALFAGDKSVFLHLMTCVTGGCSSAPEAADSRNSLLPDNPVLSKKSSIANRYLKKAEDKLVRLGVEREQISSSVLPAGLNIAGAVQHEAEKQLVDSVLVGRRGLDYLSEVLMGSVSSALFKDCHTVPLWIIDGDVESRNIFVPVDGSLPSLLAIDHIAHILGKNPNVNIYLFHCARFFGKKITCQPEMFYDKWDKKWCDTYLSGDGCLFKGPTRLLVEAGIEPDQITILPEVSDLEESHGIIKQAIKHDCGTIVIGRRGLGIAKGILGGVSERTVKKAHNVALWIVG